ncbi:MAG: beta-ketoacyl synthase [Bacteroidales bacterium]|nr:beta-ketoacyl synthase [Bacteroidales bacterium]
MTERVACIGYGALTPVGPSASASYQAVREGNSALRPYEGMFGCKEPFVASLFGQRDCLADCSFLETIAIRSAREAIGAAGIDPSSSRVAFVFSSIKGNIEALGREDVSLAVSAARIARFFQNPNVPLVVSNACISGLAAMVQGRRMLLSGRWNAVVVVGAEVQSRFIVTGFQSLKALSAAPCKPFDAERDGLNLGEAAAAMVLALSDQGWELADGAIRNDANHISGPSRTGEGSYNALRYVLSSIAAEELAFVNAHGTATRYNDEMEAVALGRAGLSGVPVNSLKGCFGHTMGAAGILESILSMQACEEGLVLPTRGFSSLGVSEPLRVSAHAQPCTGRAFVKLLSGFGGVNGALLFKKGGVR